MINYWARKCTYNLGKLGLNFIVNVDFMTQLITIYLFLFYFLLFKTIFLFYIFSRRKTHQYLDKTNCCISLIEEFP